MSVAKTVKDILEGRTFGVAGSVMALAMKQRDEERGKVLAQQVGEVLTSCEVRIQSLVECLRNIRKQEKEVKKALDQLTLALQYFTETGNPLPFFASYDRHVANNYLRALNITDEPEDWKIPEGWKPQTETEGEKSNS